MPATHDAQGGKPVPLPQLRRLLLRTGVVEGTDSEALSVKATVEKSWRRRQS